MNWYGKTVKARLTEAGKDLAKEIAFTVEANTKVNIVDNDQVDSGFMVNSVYTVLPGEDNYTEAVAAAKARALRKMGPKASLDGADAAVAVGAEYAIFQELHKSFLLKAVEQTKNDAPEAIKRVSQRQRLV